MSTSTTKLGLTKPAAGELYSRAVLNNNMDLVDNEAIAIAKMAKGLLQAPVLVTASSGGVTDAIINNIPSFSFKGGRKYRVVWDTSYYQSVTSDLFQFQICTCSTADVAGLLTGLTLIGGRTKGILAAANSTQHNGDTTAYYNPVSDITVQLKFRILRIVGTGTLVVVGQAAEPATYIIYDDGAQF